jgi:hypothetical protein
VDDLFQTTLKRLPLAKVKVFSDLGATARYFDVSRVQQQELDLAYQQLRALALDHLGVPNAEKVNFNHSKMTVWYKEANGIEHVKDLQEIVDRNPEAKEAFEILDDLVRPLWGAPLRGHFIEAGKKSCSVGTRAMERSDNLALKSLPTDYAKSAKLALELYAKKEPNLEKQKEALKRIALVESIIAPIVPQVTAVNEELAQEEARLANTATPLDQRPQIKAHIVELKTLQKKLSVDRVGLYVAVAFAPLPALNQTSAQTLANAQRAAKDAQEELQRHFDAVRKKMESEGATIKNGFFGFLHKIDRFNLIPTSWKMNMNEVSENKVYSIDVAALVFSSLPLALARHGALDFWRNNRAFQKIDTLEDELIRFALVQDTSEIPQLEGSATALDTGKRAAQNLLNGTTSYPDISTFTKIEDKVKAFEVLFPTT